MYSKATQFGDTNSKRNMSHRQVKIHVPQSNEQAEAPVCDSESGCVSGAGEQLSLCSNQIAAMEPPGTTIGGNQEAECIKNDDIHASAVCGNRKRQYSDDSKRFVCERTRIPPDENKVDSQVQSISHCPQSPDKKIQSFTSQPFQKRRGRPKKSCDSGKDNSKTSKVGERKADVSRSQTDESEETMGFVKPGGSISGAVEEGRECPTNQQNKQETTRGRREVQERGQGRGRGRGRGKGRGRGRGTLTSSDKDRDDSTGLANRADVSRQAARPDHSRTAISTSPGQYLSRNTRKVAPDEETTETAEDAQEMKEMHKGTCLDKADQKTYQVQIAMWEAQLQELHFAKCPLCYCRRRYMESMLQHFQKCSSNTPDSFPCRHCQREFQSAAGLKYHLMSVHHDMNMQQNGSESSDSPQLSYSDMKMILRKVGKLTCHTADCNKSFTTMAGYLYHEKTCGKEAIQVNCEICGKSYGSKAGLAYHMKVVHAPPPTAGSEPKKRKEAPKPEGGGRVKRRAAQRALTNMHDLTRDMEESEKTSNRGKKDKTDQTDKTTRKKVRKRQGEQHGVDSDEDSAVNDDDFDEGSTDDASDYSDEEEEILPSERRIDHRRKLTVKESIPHFMRTAHKERLRRFGLPEGQTHVGDIFPVDWSSWTVLAQSESCQYLPKLQRSVRFTMKDDQPPQSLALFQALDSSQSEACPCLNFFVGGPVWSIAWCPRPASQPTMTEYAVISGHQSQDDYHYTNRLYPGPGAVQLWAFHGLEQLNQPRPSCRLVCCMAHDYGCVWDMKWCPSGCWQTVSPSGSDSTGAADFQDSKNRLGLLALACSDGSVRILNVPSADYVESLQDSCASPTVLHLQSSLTLWPGLDPSGEITSSCGQCWCVDWAPDSGHTKVAGGFSNGCVALWDLLSKCPLLLLRDASGSSALPYCVYEAHDARLTSLSWCPYDANFVATVSTDRQVKIWDVRTPEVALATFPHGPCSSCKWLNYSGAIAATQDYTSFAVNKMFCFCTGTVVSENSRRGITSSSSTDLNLDFSDWLNSLLWCSTDGGVSLFILPQFSRLEPLRKDNHNGRKWHVYSTKIHQHQPWDKIASSASVVTVASPESEGEPSESSNKLASTSSISASSNSLKGTSDPQTDSCKVMVSKQHAEGDPHSNHSQNTQQDIIKQEHMEVTQLTPEVGNGIGSQSKLHREDEDAINELVARIDAGQELCTLQAEELKEESLLGALSSGTVQDTGSDFDLQLSQLFNACKEVEQIIQGDSDQVSYPSASINSQDLSTVENSLSTNNVNHGTGPGRAGVATGGQHDFIQMPNCQVDSMTAADKITDTPATSEDHGAQSDGCSTKFQWVGEPGSVKQTVCDDKLLEEDALNTNSTPRTDLMSIPQPSTWGMPKTFQEFVNKVYISFEDSVMDDLKSSAWKTRSLGLSCEKVPSCEAYKQRSLVAVHRACFNPNLGAHTWILSGGQTGIVRAHRIYALHAQTAMDAIRNQDI